MGPGDGDLPIFKGLAQRLHGDLDEATDIESDDQSASNLAANLGGTIGPAIAAWGLAWALSVQCRSESRSHADRGVELLGRRVESLRRRHDRDPGEELRARLAHAEDAYEKALEAEIASMELLSIAPRTPGFDPNDVPQSQVLRRLVELLDRSEPVTSELTSADWYLRANALFAAGRLHSALAAYREALRGDANLLPAQIGRAAALSRLGRSEEAIELFLSAEEKAPPELRNEIVVGRAFALGEAGSYDEALSLFRDVQANDPGNVGALNGMGTVLWLSGRVEEAIASHERALELAPPASWTLNRLGFLYADLGRHDRALDAWERALNVDPLDPIVLMNLGTALDRLGRHREAITRYKTSLEIRPGHPLTLFNLSGALAQEAEFEDALEALSSALASGFRDFALLESDEMLEPLRSHPLFGQRLADAVQEVAGGGRGEAEGEHNE